jgi:hypothetical protein
MLDKDIVEFCNVNISCNDIVNSFDVDAVGSVLKVYELLCDMW